MCCLTRIQKFVQLQRPERWLLLRALVLLAVVRLSLRLLPFDTLERLLSKLMTVDADAGKQQELSVERRIWAVQTASRYIPHATCLTQALTAQVLLGLGGIPACVRIGVSKAATEELEAHAWLESGGEVLLGGSDAEQKYTSILVLNSTCSSSKAC
jgi:hypothetical protein